VIAPGGGADDIRTTAAVDHREVVMLAARRTILRALFVAVIAGLALAGTAGAAATGPQVQIAPADQAWAQSILLGTADLGAGWSALSNGGGDAGDASASMLCPGFNPDESDLVVTGGSGSPNFMRRDGAVVSSAATVWQTPEHAQADWDRMVQPQLLDCLGSAVTAGSTKKLRIVIRGKGQRQFPGVATRTTAYRLALSFRTSRKVKGKLKKIAVPATFDLVLLGNGRATGVLIFVFVNAKPISASYEQTVAGLMAQRLAKDPSATS
jgi:hypothetical protein